MSRLDCVIKVGTSTVFEEEGEDASVLRSCLAGHQLAEPPIRGAKRIPVATTSRCDQLDWKSELIEIVACPAAWRLLPLPVQQQIWSRLLGCLLRDHPIAHDRPEIRRLSEATFRAIMDRAVAENNARLIEDLVADCPYWEMGRDELLQQSAWELRRWHRLLRLPKNVNVRDGIKDFVRALRYAAGLIVATECEAEPMVEPNLVSDARRR